MKASAAQAKLIVEGTIEVPPNDLKCYCQEFNAFQHTLFALMLKPAYFLHCTWACRLKYPMLECFLWGCRHTGIYFYHSWPRRTGSKTYLKSNEDLGEACRPHIPHLLPLDCTKRLNQPALPHFLAYKYHQQKHTCLRDNLHLSHNTGYLVPYILYAIWTLRLNQLTWIVPSPPMPVFVNVFQRICTADGHWGIGPIFHLNALLVATAKTYAFREQIFFTECLHAGLPSHITEQSSCPHNPQLCLTTSVPTSPTFLELSLTHLGASLHWWVRSDNTWFTKERLWVQQLLMKKSSVRFLQLAFYTFNSESMEI